MKKLTLKRNKIVLSEFAKESNSEETSRKDSCLQEKISIIFLFDFENNS
ncbi:MAG: hypothetical protein LR001_04210 [Clostridiales bacterium]|nr:hypothetical protein [Clostridiales bacterium]